MYVFEPLYYRLTANLFSWFRWGCFKKSRLKTCVTLTRVILRRCFHVVSLYFLMFSDLFSEVVQIDHSRLKLIDILKFCITTLYRFVHELVRKNGLLQWICMQWIYFHRFRLNVAIETVSAAARTCF